MPLVRLVAWGRKQQAVLRAWSVVVLALALGSSACGSGSGSKRAVECRTDADCDGSELGICQTAACENNRCVEEQLPDGQRCDDDDPVTGEDACLDGLCAGTVKDCDDELGPCLRAVFDPVSGECVVEPADDGVECDDGNACTQADTCDAGECQGGERKTCEALDDCHVAGECDPESGECSEVAAPDGTGCDDGRVCTTGDACQAGSCTGEGVVCVDDLACSLDSCQEAAGGCVSDMTDCACLVDEDCDDGNACNGREHCDPGSKLCQAGSTVVCPESGDPCLQNTCVPETGACEPEAAPNGTACDDASACTARDSCQAGECVGSSPVVCTALSQCHQAGSCDPITGACSNPEKGDDTGCNDGNACTPSDSCQDGACVGSGSVVCSPSDQCHDAGVCNPQTGACSNPAKTDGVRCDDGNACTLGDSCQDGSCAPASTKACDPLDACHDAGTCNPQTGACSNPQKPNGASCEDGKLCTTSDACVAGKCEGTSPSCDDGVACTSDSCSEELGGCVSGSGNCACTTSADCNDKNPCNGVEVCNLQTLTCQPGTPVDCSGLSDACNVGTCSATTGSCVATPKQNGTTCDDGDLCTQTSSCQAGICKGASPVTCTALDQCHDAGVCNPSTGKCTEPAKNNGTACNDSNACTKTDSCQGGVCTGSGAVVCTALDQCHNAGTCDPSTGVCTDPAKTNGSACSDGDLCTRTDSCQGGVCLGASPVTCSASDQCHLAGTCDSTTGLCSDPVKKDGSACSDGDLCTQTDTCQAGECSGADPVKCTALDQCHVVGTCDPDTGACSNPNKTNGAACSDGSLCTQTDTCQSGACTGSSPKSCPASDQCHSAGTCDAATGDCSNPEKPDRTPCDDGKTCTASDQCTGGKCGGSAVVCDDGISCSVDSCGEPGGCKVDLSQCGCTSDAKCDDGNPCNGVEKCDLDTLACVSGTPVSCANLDDACNTGTCDRQTGACKKAPKTDGTTCDDGSACTRSDACAMGACVGSDPVVCTALDQCHAVGVCAPATGVCSNPNKTDGTTCNDNNACTQTDSCQTGECKGTNPVACVALDQCHVAGTCNTKTGVCTNPAKGDGSGCNDGDKCTQTDTCQAGECKGANPVVCTASDQCHDVGTCAPATGNCTNPAKQNGTLCDDSDKCTRTDSCQAGKCTGSDPVTCSSLGTCYDVGSCDPGTGICSNPYSPPGTSCSDGNACTSGEACTGTGKCDGGSAVICQPPANTCRTNTCNVATGCQLGNKPNGTPCDDTSACTQLDSCSKGVCLGSSPRTNKNGDWSDDPGYRGAGPISVDTFTDKSGNAVIVGTYRGPIFFNDKEDTKTATPLALGDKQTIGIYWTVYGEKGVVDSAANIGGGTGTLTVEHAAGHDDGSFSLLGTVQGSVVFGLNGKGQPLDAKNLLVWVAHYQSDGNLAWLAQFEPGGEVSVTASSIAAFDDDSVIAIGTTSGAMEFRNAKNERFDLIDTGGVWAARLGASGGGQWARLVVWPQGGASAHAVTTHEDGAASLTGAFSGTAELGPGKEISVSVSVNEVRSGRDIWFQRLDKEGSLKWGGRVGGTAADQPGDVARIKGGGTMLLASTRGTGANANDAGTTQPLYTANASLFQTHVLVLDSSGNLKTDGLIADGEAGHTRGYQLELDPAGAYAVAGTFGSVTKFYGKIGFGSGPPPGGAQLTVASLYQGPDTLFAARVDESAGFAWAVQAGGDNSGMATSSWDVVMTGHASHAVTIAGMFNAQSYFGDQVPELLQADPELGNPFVVHLNSEAEYDYCQ